MKIKKLNDFCAINEAQVQMNFNQNGPYTPQTELELVEIVHDIFGDKLNKKQKVSQRDINAINIDLSNIKDVTNVTKNMVKRRKLFLSDFAFTKRTRSLFQEPLFYAITMKYMITR